MRLIVGISDAKISTDAESVIVTHGLGSCIAIGIYDRKLKIGGMIHYMLPLSGAKKTLSDFNPYMYGDSGIPKLFDQLSKMGSQKTNQKIVMVGGASIQNVGMKDHFEIGSRNIAIARKYFWQNALLLESENVGGGISRTFYLELSSGTMYFTSQGNRVDL